MGTKSLHDLWSTLDNNRFTSKQFSFRLPVHIAAKIEALCNMYPQKNKTQIVSDLLTQSLDELEKSLPYSIAKADAGTQKDAEEICKQEGYNFSPIHYLHGPRADFRKISNQYYREYETELGNESPKDLFSTSGGSKEFIQKALDSE